MILPICTSTYALHKVGIQKHVLILQSSKVKVEMSAREESLYLPVCLSLPPKQEGSRQARVEVPCDELLAMQAKA